MSDLERAKDQLRDVYDDDYCVVSKECAESVLAELTRLRAELAALKHDLTAAYMAGYEEGKGKLVDEAAELAALKERLRGLGKRHVGVQYADDGTPELYSIPMPHGRWIRAADLDAVIGND